MPWKTVSVVPPTEEVFPQTLCSLCTATTPTCPLQVRPEVLRTSHQRLPNRRTPCLQEPGARVLRRERTRTLLCKETEAEPTWPLLHQSHHTSAAAQVSSVCPLGGEEVRGQEAESSCWRTDGEWAEGKDREIMCQRMIKVGPHLSDLVSLFPDRLLLSLTVSLKGDLCTNL